MPKMKLKSIEDLRRELNRRELELAKLNARRDQAMARVTKIDAMIAKVAGQAPAAAPVAKAKTAAPKAAASAKGKPGRRPNPNSLIGVMQSVLAASGTPMRIKDLVPAVLDAGYKSASKDFAGIVSATIRDKKKFKRVGRGVYTLAK